MAQNNENTEQSCASVTLCSGGCGFFGNTQFDGMCSKCYKDALRRKQAPPQETSVERASPSIAALSAAASSYLSSIETASPTVPVASKSIQSETEPSTSTAEDIKEEGATTALSAAAKADESAAATDDRPATPSTEIKSKKRNRCSTCKKKVGLTGFECRCGGLYCSSHRYSDKHDCQFDYKKEGEELIRRNNPVVVGAKLQKI